MNRFLFFFLYTFCCSFFIPAKAQHCQYDFYSLIGIIPYTSDSSRLINGLTITLVDESGNPVTGRQKIITANSNDAGIAVLPFQFWRNPPFNNDTDHHNRNIQKRHFAFASGHYILAFSTGQGKKKSFYVKIEDRDGNKNGGSFNTVIVNIPAGNLMSLCGYDLRSDHHDAYYQPLKVKLQPKINDEATDSIILPEDKFIRKHIPGIWKDQNSTFTFYKNKTYTLVFDSVYTSNNVYYKISKRSNVEGIWDIKKGELILLSYKHIKPNQYYANQDQSYKILYFSPTQMKYQLISGFFEDKTIWIADKIK